MMAGEPEQAKAAEAFVRPQSDPCLHDAARSSVATVFLGTRATGASPARSIAIYSVGVVHEIADALVNRSLLE